MSSQLTTVGCAALLVLAPGCSLFSATPTLPSSQTSKTHVAASASLPCYGGREKSGVMGRGVAVVARLVGRKVTSGGACRYRLVVRVGDRFVVAELPRIVVASTPGVGVGGALTGFVQLGSPLAGYVVVETVMGGQEDDYAVYGLRSGRLAPLQTSTNPTRWVGFAVGGTAGDLFGVDCARHGTIVVANLYATLPAHRTWHGTQTVYRVTADQIVHERTVRRTLRAPLGGPPRMVGIDFFGSCRTSAWG
jgi:hypothetical protein